MEALRKFWHAWKRFGQFMGDLIGRLVLTVFYFTLFMPFGLGVRFLGTRWHYIRAAAQIGWNVNERSNS